MWSSTPEMFVGIAEAFSPKELASQFDVNVVGIHRVNRAFLPAMRKRGPGLMINISSVAGRISVPFNAAYHARASGPSKGTRWRCGRSWRLLAST
jgi:NADP-dependent 3-hydroxy acid dehydrogenase YdfG